MHRRTDEWRRAKRYIEYRETKPLSEYGYDTIPGALRISRFLVQRLPLSSR